MKKSHEQSVIDGFFKYFYQKSIEQQKRLTRSSMDGQDSILGGDYLFTDNTKFVIVEFKYQEKDLKSEGKKYKRKDMCEKLNLNYQCQQWSLRCHYIAWSVKRHVRRVYFNQYYHEICNQNIFKSDNLKQISPNHSLRISADIMIKEFFNHSLGSTYFEFKKYIDCITNHSGDIEILLDNPDSKQFEMIDFNSLERLKTWLDMNKPNPDTSYQPEF